MQVLNGPEIWKKKQTNKQIVTLQHLMASRKSATKTLIDKLRVADTNNSRPSELFNVRSWRDGWRARQTFFQAEG